MVCWEVSFAVVSSLTSRIPLDVIEIGLCNNVGPLTHFTKTFAPYITLIQQLDLCGVYYYVAEFMFT